MMIIYIDIILLVILLVLTFSTCGYCFYRIHRMRQNGQVAILLQPTKVLFSHKMEGHNKDVSRTVVAYQNPFTGDYYVHRSPQPKGYENQLLSPASTDSGLSDAYEPLHLEPVHQQRPALGKMESQPAPAAETDYRVNKTWNWNYKEYQI